MAPRNGLMRVNFLWANRFLPSNGFTLVEMMIALAIGASIALVSYRALDGAIRADEKVSRVMQSVDGIDRAWQYLANDLGYALPRGWKDRRGEQHPALWGALGDRLSQSDVVVSDEDSYLMQWVRGGRDNLFNLPRSDLYVVGYRLTQGDAVASLPSSDRKTLQLWRDSWAPVDGSELKVRQLLLLEGIETLAFRYLPANATGISDGAWLPGWPQPQTPQNLLPAAVEVTVELAGLGKVVRVFEVTAQYP